jgi:hypothetical protein
MPSKKTYNFVSSSSSSGVLKASQSDNHAGVAEDEDSEWHEILETQTRPSVSYLSS